MGTNMGTCDHAHASLRVFLLLWHLLCAQPVDASYLLFTAMNTGVSTTLICVKGWLISAQLFTPFDEKRVMCACICVFVCDPCIKAHMYLSHQVSERPYILKMLQNYNLPLLGGAFSIYQLIYQKFIIKPQRWILEHCFRHLSHWT